MKKILNFINGQHQGLSKDFLSVEDPSTGEKISEVIISNKQDFENAIDSAKNSQIDWERTTPLKRSRVLSKYKN